MKERQSGPLMKRVKIDDREYVLPADATVALKFPSSGTEEEQKAWIKHVLEEPLGGTW